MAKGVSAIARILRCSETDAPHDVLLDLLEHLHAHRYPKYGRATEFDDFRVASKHIKVAADQIVARRGLRLPLVHGVDNAILNDITPSLKSRLTNLLFASGSIFPYSSRQEWESNGSILRHRARLFSSDDELYQMAQAYPQTHPQPEALHVLRLIFECFPNLRTIALGLDRAVGKHIENAHKTLTTYPFGRHSETSLREFFLFLRTQPINPNTKVDTLFYSSPWQFDYKRLMRGGISFEGISGHLDKILTLDFEIGIHIYHGNDPHSELNYLAPVLGMFTGIKNLTLLFRPKGDIYESGFNYGAKICNVIGNTVWPNLETIYLDGIACSAYELFSLFESHEVSLQLIGIGYIEFTSGSFRSFYDLFRNSRAAKAHHARNMKIVHDGTANDLTGSFSSRYYKKRMLSRIAEYIMDITCEWPWVDDGSKSDDELQETVDTENDEAMEDEESIDSEDDLEMEESSREIQKLPIDERPYDKDDELWSWNSRAFEISLHTSTFTITASKSNHRFNYWVRSHPIERLERAYWATL